MLLLMIKLFSSFLIFMKVTNLNLGFQSVFIMNFIGIYYWKVSSFQIKLITVTLGLLLPR